MAKILIVDDEDDIRTLLQYNLEKEGYSVETAENGETALKMVSSFKPDLVLLDVMMPGMDGIEVCETIRSNESYKNILICFLTARSEDYSQIAGLEAGADDYVSKPIRPKVLISRIKAMLRRIEGGDKTQDTSTSIIINRDKYYVEKGGEIIHLPRKEFELLSLLASKPNHVFERDVILDRVWGTDIVVGDRTIDVHIRKLREKIGESHIRTVKGIGYKFIIDPEKSVD
jgi:two-component system alkaline phosphatase synthesis response regulator PhoP